MSGRRRQPTHSLEAVQAAVAEGQYFLQPAAVEGASEVLCSTADVEACIAALGPDNFDKTMESKARPGRWQDVYRTSHPEIASMRIYLKFDLTRRGVVILSFKHDEGPL